MEYSWNYMYCQRDRKSVAAQSYHGQLKLKCILQFNENYVYFRRRLIACQNVKLVQLIKNLNLKTERSIHFPLKHDSHFLSNTKEINIKKEKPLAIYHLILI